MRVLIDAGHGESHEKHDPGAVALGKSESDFTEIVAVKALNVLRKSFGVEAFLTRGDHPNALHPKGYNPANSPKWRIEDSKGFDLLVSIHWNSSVFILPNGTEVLVTKMTNQNIRLANDILARIIGGLNHYCRVKKIDDWVPKSRGVKKQGLALLRHQEIPCCLVECEFLTNPAVSRLMEDESFTWTIGYSIAKGIASFLGVTEDANLTHLAHH